LLIGLEIFTILQLLRIAQVDFFAFLFAISSMQAMQQFTVKEAAVSIGLTTLLTFLTLLKPMGILNTLALTVFFFGRSVFLVVYIGATRRARSIQDQQQGLVNELQQTNLQLESYAQQLQQLAAGRERQRLARELHDSVTQTLFSLTLTTQSALLLLERDQHQVAAQLDRLDQLARSALVEMQVLISRLAHEAITGAGFVSTLQQHLSERRRLDLYAGTYEFPEAGRLTLSVTRAGNKLYAARSGSPPQELLPLSTTRFFVPHGYDFYQLDFSPDVVSGTCRLILTIWGMSYTGWRK
jgi:signal transduction histidine kinase